MISTQLVITRFRRDLTVGRVIKSALLAGAVATILIGPFVESRIDSTVVLFIIAAVWIGLSFRSIRGSRLAAESPSLIAAGQFDAAEQRISSALQSFSIFKTVKLSTLHHLATLRHAQHRWDDVAAICQALLRHRGVTGGVVVRSSHLMLADSLLAMGDLRGAHLNLMRLYEQRLSLSEALVLMRVQTDYESRVGQWAQMMIGIDSKIALAELMPTTASVRTQALLALAARRTSRPEWASWLRRRIELMTDVQRLVAELPIVAEVWEDCSAHLTGHADCSASSR